MINERRLRASMSTTWFILVLILHAANCEKCGGTFSLLALFLHCAQPITRFIYYFITRLLLQPKWIWNGSRARLTIAKGHRLGKIKILSNFRPKFVSRLKNRAWFRCNERDGMTYYRLLLQFVEYLYALARWNQVRVLYDWLSAL